MKTMIKATAILAFLALSCNTKTSTSSDKKSDGTEVYACPMHPEVTGAKGEKCSKCNMELTEPVASQSRSAADDSKTQDAFREVLHDYIELKNALASDDSSKAAQAGNAMLGSTDALSHSTLTPEQAKIVKEVGADLRENAEHIGDNAGKIEHQREHFVMLSKDMDDLLATFKSDRKLYQDFCPMADGNKGAIWISETKEIKNPYFGKAMATCGTVKKEL